MTTQLAPCTSCKGSGKDTNYWGEVGECIICGGGGTEGCYNPSADAVPRKDKTSSDCNLTRQDWGDRTFERLRCACGGLSFEVLGTSSYETSARCDGCGAYYIVHCG